MNTRGRVGLNAPSVTELHRAWLELVDTEGPFLAIPPLKRVWPQGMPALSDGRKAALVDARKDFEAAWERFDRTPDNDAVLDSYRVARDKWVETVLRDVAGWAESLSWGEAPGLQAQSPNRAVTVTAHAALNGVDGIGALVHVVDPTDSLRQTPNDLWAATPVDRTEALLRENKVQLGIVTDGRWWGLVCAREGAMAASGIVDALTWIEEPRTRDAFLALIARQHIIGGDPTERLPVLFEESVAAAEEITEALGAQVRSAVELLIQSFSESAADAGRRGLPDPLPVRTHETYEAAVTVMMRVVFLLFAEERGLLPSGELFDQGYGIARELDRLIARETEESEEALDSTSLTWHRLLATSQALFRGASFESLRMPAYGGSLFDRERFGFLTEVTEQGPLAVTVSDRVMLHVLRSVQIASIKGEARRISFRDIDVEQIGYIYEGLLGYTARKVDQTYVGLKGTVGAEPEIPLTKLEELAGANADSRKFADAIRTWVEQDQPSAKSASVTALAKGLTADVAPNIVSALIQAVGDNHELRDRVTPWLGLIRLDLRRRPFVVLPGGLMVKETPSRKNAGAHYTPKSLAEEVVLHALQPLCYSPGPHQTADQGAWTLKSSDELLDLKVADIACGSGAFLVAAARYLADRLVEAWIAEEPANAARRDLHTRALRQVVASCLYGADINDMAVEMCKLSLWLVSLDRDLPFSFVDDKIFVGNSLLGITSLDQLRKLHIDPARVSSQQMFEIFSVDIDRIIRKAVALRQRLASEIDENDPARTSTAKQRQLAELNEVTSVLRSIADGVIAAGLPLGGKPGRALDDAYENLRLAVQAAHPRQGMPDRSFLESLISSGLRPEVPTDYERWQPLHWVLVAPDVMVERGGFDAVVGNPPFLVSKKITGAMGTKLREWVVEQVAGGRRGGADLVAFFVVRAAALVNRTSGGFGLVTSKVVAEGDTREVSLDALLRDGLTIYAAKSSEPWPSTGVAVRYSMVCCTFRKLEGEKPAWLDGKEVSAITAQLDARRRVVGTPMKLSKNSGRIALGAYVHGDGFVLDPKVASELLAEDASNSDVVFPYLSGADLNSSPDPVPSRWVINFHGWPIERARQYRGPFGLIERLVQPIRATNKMASRRDIWWRYAVRADRLHEQLVEAGHGVAITVVSKFGYPVRVKAGPILTSAIAVVPDASFDTFGQMAASPHNLWAWQWGSTMKSDLRYTPSDVFETFPFAPATPAVAELGRKLEYVRSEVMTRLNLGLTKFYNVVHDPVEANDAGISEVRELHEALDLAVLAAYGWEDLDLHYGFHMFRQSIRWTVCPDAREEILDRLLEENHKRAAAGGTTVSRRKRRDSAALEDKQSTLFDEG